MIFTFLRFEQWGVVTGTQCFGVWAEAEKQKYQNTWKNGYYGFDLGELIRLQ